MSITSRISSMEEHVTNAYNGLQGLGADLTNVDKNIDNIASVLDDIYDSMPQVSGEGTSLTLDDTRVGKIKSTLKGNTSQTGTPTPSSPIPVNVVSGDNEISVCGKNLIGLGTILHAYRDNSTGKIQLNDNCVGYYFPTSVLPDTITFSCVGGNRANISYYNSVPASTVESVDYSNSNSLPRTISVNKTYAYIFIQFSYNTLDVTNIQLEKGSTASTYEPYNGDTYNIDLPEGMELCKIGNYQDYFYKDSDKWYLHKEIGKVVLNGSENWMYDSSHTRFLSTIYSTATMLRGQGFCDHYKYGDSVNRGYFDINVDKKTIYMFTPDNSITTSNTFKTWLGTNLPIVYYVLATPTSTEITYQPLIDQLNAIEKAMSKDGQTNISQVNNDLPFIISASSLKEWQESTSLNSTLSMVNPLSLGNTLNTQEIDNNTQPIEVDNIEPLEEEENEES